MCWCILCSGFPLMWSCSSSWKHILTSCHSLHIGCQVVSCWQCSAIEQSDWSAKHPLGCYRALTKLFKASFPETKPLPQLCSAKPENDIIATVHQPLILSSFLNPISMVCWVPQAWGLMSCNMFNLPLFSTLWNACTIVPTIWIAFGSLSTGYQQHHKEVYYTNPKFIKNRFWHIKSNWSSSLKQLLSVCAWYKKYADVPVLKGYKRGCQMSHATQQCTTGNSGFVTWEGVGWKGAYGRRLYLIVCSANNPHEASSLVLTC